MNSKNKWEETRNKGKARYILFHGVLGWGVPTAILWSILMEFISPTDAFWQRLLIALILFPIGGIAFGYFTWIASESKYKKENPDS